MTVGQWTGETLSDYLAPDLHLLSIGLNPSLNSVRAAFYFATPQNRFWKALNASPLCDEELVPGIAAMERLLTHCRIGFTDVAKRPSASGSALRAADFRAGATVLHAHIEQLEPRIAWFHGKVAYRNFLKYGLASADACEWGEQERRIGETRIFVSPNPSPANAAYSLADLTHWFTAVARLRDQLVRGR